MNKDDIREKKNKELKNRDIVLSFSCYPGLRETATLSSPNSVELEEVRELVDDWRNKAKKENTNCYINLNVTDTRENQVLVLGLTRNFFARLITE